MKAFQFIGFALLIFLSMSCDKEGTPTPNDPSDMGSSDSLSGTVKVIQDQFKGLDVVVIGSQADNLLLAFDRNLDGTLLSFESVNFNPPAIMQDNEGNRWDAMGTAISGPREGQQLKGVNSYIGYWFAWGTFYPVAEIYGEALSNEHFEPLSSDDAEWTVPKNKVVSGGVPPDGIPAITNPGFYSANDINAWERSEGAIENLWIQNSDLVVGIKIGDEARAYPHLVLDWHEIVNDDIGEESFAIIYCPLTGTATCWNRHLAEGIHTTFGVSGLLYNSNIIPFDRATGSRWSQMRVECINGELIGNTPETISIVETTWGTWRALYPETSIVNPEETGHARSYGRYPYGDYRTNDSNLIFSVEYDDFRIDRKDRVMGIIVDGEAKVYPMDKF